MSPGFVVGAAGVIIGGDFKPARYTGAVTERYTSDRVLPFPLSHQGGGIVWWYGIADIVGRYSVSTRTCHLTKKIFCYQLHYWQTNTEGIYLLCTLYCY